VLVSLLTSLLTFGITGLVELGALLIPQGGDAAAQELRKFIVNQVIGALVGVLLAPLLPLAATLLYYDLRVRREGFDIAARAAEIGFPLAPDPFGDALHPRTPPARSAPAASVAAAANAVPGGGGADRP
jgi:hypothetical protein